jgi:hypothetical protein
MSRPLRLPDASRFAARDYFDNEDLRRTSAFVGRNRRWGRGLGEIAKRRVVEIGIEA